MSMDFCSIDDKAVTYSINNRGWRRIFLLGLMFGWVPRGTTAPAGWDGRRPWDAQNYTTNDCQVVTALDALDLANAIIQAIPLLKAPTAADKPQPAGYLWELELFRRFEHAMETGLRDPGYIFFDARWSDKLTELAGFCRKGAFKIC